MTQKKIRGDQIDLTLADGSVLTGVNADLLQGNNAAFYRDAGNLNAGTLLDARVAQSNVTQHEGALSIGGGQVIGAVADSNALGGTAAASYALLASPAFTGNPTAPTQTAGNNSTRLATTAFVTTAVSGSGASVVTSGVLAYNGASSTTFWSHLQGSTPKIVQIYLVNAIAEGGYVPGNIISLNHTLSESDSGGGPQNDGIAVQVTSTQVIVRVANRRALSLSTANVNFQPSAANWTMLIQAIF